MTDNQENHHLSTIHNQLYEQIRDDSCSENDMAVRDEDLPMTANKAYQHSPKGTSSRMEDLDTTDSSLQAYKAYRSITIGSLKHFNGNSNTLITAIKEFQSTTICDRNSVGVYTQTQRCDL